MKNNKIFLFLARFLGVYFLLFLAYSFFLKKSQQADPVFKVDAITNHVAQKTVVFLEAFNVNVLHEQHETEHSVKLFINDVYTARVIEGCNAMSVIILFIAFIIAFRSNIIKTTAFILLGGLSIYIVNIVRVALLVYLIYKEPAMTEWLHSLLFPAIIYGYVFLLWILWVNKFSDFKKRGARRRYAR